MPKFQTKLLKTSNKIIFENYALLNKSTSKILAPEHIVHDASYMPSCHMICTESMIQDVCHI